jgi:molecular chaperone GrpE
MAEKKDKVNSKKKSKKNTEEVKVESKKGQETKKSGKEQEVEVEEQVEVQEQGKEEAQDFETKYNELNDKYLRLTAEFDNFRRRSLKEKMELIKSAGEDILVNILPVMDNFERALKSMEGNGEDGKNAVIEGVELIYNNFKDFLAQRGVKEIEAIGKEFDTDHPRSNHKNTCTRRRNERQSDRCN